MSVAWTFKAKHLLMGKLFVCALAFAISLSLGLMVTLGENDVASSQQQK